MCLRMEHQQSLVDMLNGSYMQHSHTLLIYLHIDVFDLRLLRWDETTPVFEFQKGVVA